MGTNNPQTISPIRGLTRIGSSIMQLNKNGQAPEYSQYPYMLRNASNASRANLPGATLQIPGQGAAGFTAPITDPSKPAYNTPMNVRPYMPGFYQPSPNVDIDRPRLTLQMSLPQMSEIPNEERVQYAYQKQVELQKKINGHTNAAR